MHIRTLITSQGWGRLDSKAKFSAWKIGRKSRTERIRGDRRRKQHRTVDVPPLFRVPRRPHSPAKVTAASASMVIMPDTGSSLRLFTLLAVISAVVAISKRDFYPFGTASSGDSELPSYDDVSSPEIHFPTSVRFLEGSYDYGFVNQNGFVSFESELPYFSSRNLNEYAYPIIAVFLSDVDPRGITSAEDGGRVFYRSQDIFLFVDKFIINSYGIPAVRDNLIFRCLSHSAITGFAG
ncbi:unnamed protein product [Soboliphyme baturini]|uniref:Peptidase A1 domain-containing protein n=1 Tax=Soboliphyme baturini TaxID=241478 RepID=A0A183J3I3_9BILA|nr:unnamed protein product [Soboliphyme baturini]